MIDYYVRRKRDDEKAVKEKEVQMIVKGDSGVSKTYPRSSPGVLIVASLFGKANGEQFTLVVDVDPNIIIALLMAVVVILLTMLVSRNPRTLSCSRGAARHGGR